mmetsp:Transcript_20877/g.50412  ORF Transcript_20877/g.50412 Transcript_20877/m.50412 type:complete len:381 (+) Transcript_20877:145-1287(+)
MCPLRIPSDHGRIQQGARRVPAGGGEQVCGRQRSACEEARAGRTAQDGSLRYGRCRANRLPACGRFVDRRRGYLAAGALGWVWSCGRVFNRRPRRRLRPPDAARHGRLLRLLLRHELGSGRAGCCGGWGARCGGRIHPVCPRRYKCPLSARVRRPSGRRRDALRPREYRGDAVAEAGRPPLPAGARRRRRLHRLAPRDRHRGARHRARRGGDAGVGAGGAADAGPSEDGGRVAGPARRADDQPRLLRLPHRADGRPRPRLNPAHPRGRGLRRRLRGHVAARQARRLPRAARGGRVRRLGAGGPDRHWCWRRGKAGGGRCAGGVCNSAAEGCQEEGDGDDRSGNADAQEGVGQGRDGSRLRDASWSASSPERTLVTLCVAP